MAAGSAEMLGPRLGEGREAEVYAWGDDAVVKLYRPGYHRHQAEASTLNHLAGRGAAPRLIDVIDTDGRRGLVIELRRATGRVAAARAAGAYSVSGRPRHEGWPAQSAPAPRRCGEVTRDDRVAALATGRCGVGRDRGGRWHRRGDGPKPRSGPGSRTCLALGPNLVRSGW